MLSPLWAQYAVHRPSRAAKATVLRSVRASSETRAHIHLPALSLSELRGLVERGREEGFRPSTFAVERSLGLDAGNSGEWLVDEEGNYSWRLTITSPGARGIGLRLDRYVLPRGAALYIHGEDGRLRGAFTEVNNSSSGVLYLAPVEGEQITLIYESPLGQEMRDLPFVVGALHHDHHGLRQQVWDRDERGFLLGEPIFDRDRRTLLDLDCARNVVGFAEHTRQARSVVLMVIEGIAYGTGALISNVRADGTAYVLTAAHNINGLYRYKTDDGHEDLERIRRAVASLVFFFGFESQRLQGNVRATEEQTLSGAELVAYEPKADMALLRITGLPKSAEGKLLPIPVAYNAYFSGWSIQPRPEAPFFGIHHPQGSTKRYNLAEDGHLEIQDYQAGGHEWIQKHWHIKRWSIGTTAGGSSGAPLFDRNGLIIGALTGGSSSCTFPTDDYYFALCRTWGASLVGSLRDALDPDHTGATTCPGYDPHEQSRVYRLSDFAVDSPQASEPLLLTPRPEVLEIGRRVHISDEGMLPLGAYLLFSGSSALQQEFPELEIGLRRLEAGGTPGDLVWSTQVRTAGFVHYDRQGSFISSTRTMSRRDTVELFVPRLAGEVPTTLPKGDYLLSVRPLGLGALALPMLYHLERKTSSATNCFTRTAQGWERLQATLWLDLLVQSSTTPRDASYRSEPDSKILAYYHDRHIYVHLPSGIDDATLRLYNYNGDLVQSQRLVSGENIVVVYAALPRQAYVAEIKGRGGVYTLRLIND